MNDRCRIEELIELRCLINYVKEVNEKYNEVIDGDKLKYIQKSVKARKPLEMRIKPCQIKVTSLI